MVIITDVTIALICCIYCCLCWGSWGNSQKLVQQREWKSALFYWDFTMGFFLTALIGLLCLNGGNIFINVSMDTVKWAIIGGLVWNVANIFFTAANGIAGLAVGFPIGGGLGWVGGILFNYFSSGFTGNEVLLWAGVILAVSAMVFCSLAYRRLTTVQRKSPMAGIVFAILSGFGFAFFYGFVVKSTGPEYGGIGMLTPYQAVFFFALAVLLSTFLINPVMMRCSVEGRVTIKDYWQYGNMRTHLIGMMGGFVWMSGMIVSFMAFGADLSKAVVYALSNASPLVAMVWGVMIWKEFKNAPKGTAKYLLVMFLCFLLALILITCSNN